MIDPGRIWQSVQSLTGLKTERAILFPVKRSYFLCLPLLTHETDNRMFLNIFEYSTEYLCIWGIFILSLSLSLSLSHCHARQDTNYPLIINGLIEIFSPDYLCCHSERHRIRFIPPPLLQGEGIQYSPAIYGIWRCHARISPVALLLPYRAAVEHQLQ